MKRCAGLRCTSSTSRPSAPSRRRMTEADWRGVVTAPWLRRSPVVGRSLCIGPPSLPMANHYPHGMSIETATTRWICESCGFIYDPDDGDPDGGIPPGTAFTDIPDTWFCPVCGARKREFTPYED